MLWPRCVKIIWVIIDNEQKIKEVNHAVITLQLKLHFCLPQPQT